MCRVLNTLETRKLKAHFKIKRDNSVFLLNQKFFFFNFSSVEQIYPPKKNPNSLYSSSSSFFFFYCYYTVSDDFSRSRVPSGKICFFCFFFFNLLFLKALIFSSSNGGSHLLSSFLLFPFVYWLWEERPNRIPYKMHAPVLVLSKLSLSSSFFTSICLLERNLFWILFVSMGNQWNEIDSSFFFFFWIWFDEQRIL